MSDVWVSYHSAKLTVASCDCTQVFLRVHARCFLCLVLVVDTVVCTYTPHIHTHKCRQHSYTHKMLSSLTADSKVASCPPSMHVSDIWICFSLFSVAIFHVCVGFLVVGEGSQVE